NISIRRTTDDQEILRLNGPGRSIGSVAFSPDGVFLEAIYPPAQSEQGLILIWDLRGGEIAFRLTPEFAGQAVAWSPDGHCFAVHGQAETILLYGIAWRKETGRIRAGVTPHPVAFHPHGHQLATLRAGAVQIRAVETGSLVDRFSFPAPVERLSWGGDGRFLAGAGSRDSTA